MGQIVDRRAAAGRDHAAHGCHVGITDSEVGEQRDATHGAQYTRRVFETIPPPPKRLLVFARLPERGAVKTRLAADIGDDRALAVYEAMLRDTLRSIGGSSDETEVEVCGRRPTPRTRARSAAPSARRARDADRRDPRRPPLDGVLGALLLHRTERIIAVGVDDPTIPRPLIDTAFALLESCDWVLGPATDGGYYLIGCRGPAFDNDAFQEIAWGTSSVFTTTIAKIRSWERNVAVLPVRTDIDTAEDLRAAERVGRVGKLLGEWDV